jgi:CBS domain containing-hemolysin-like protein
VALALLFLLGLALSILGSGSEIAFSGASRIAAYARMRRGSGLAGMAVRIMSRPRYFLSTTLVATNVGNVLASTVGAGIGREAGGRMAETVSVVLTTVIILVAGEVMPKRLFFATRNRIVDGLSPVLTALRYLLYPVIIAAEWFSGLLTGGGGPSRFFESREEVRGMLAASGGARGEEASRMLEMATDTVYEHMVPLDSAPSIRTDQSRASLQRSARESSGPFLLVYEADGKTLLGYVRTHELLRLRGRQDPLSVTDPLPYFRQGTGAARAIFEMERVSSPAGVVLGKTGQPMGLLTVDSMVDAVLGGEGPSLSEPVGELVLEKSGCRVRLFDG